MHIKRADECGVKDQVRRPDCLVLVRAKSKGQSYCFGVLKKIIQNEYREAKEETEKELKAILDDLFGSDGCTDDELSWA